MRLPCQADLLPVRFQAKSLFMAGVAALVTLVAPTILHAAQAAPRRIVSLNLCTDQYLLALADRSQIAGLSANAKDPGMSAAAHKVGNLRILRHSAEEILDIRPDLILGMGLDRNGLMRALPGAKPATLDLLWAANYADIQRQSRLVAEAVGHPARGQALRAAMARDLAKIARPGQGRVAAYYQRRGFLSGSGTLVDDLMRRVGLVNLATKAGLPPLSTLSVEEMVAAQPDFIILEAGTDKVSDLGTEMLQHPALRHIPRLTVPEAWTVCGGPAYVQAAQTLADQIRRHPPLKRNKPAPANQGGRARPAA